MSNRLNKNEKLTIRHRLLLFLHKNSFILLGLLSVIAIMIIVLVVYTNISSKNLETATKKIEAIQDDYNKLVSSGNKENGDLKKKILTNLENIIKTGKKNYPVERALFIQGNIYYKDKEWKKSASSFEKISQYFPKSYLSPVALLNAASAREENGEVDKAMENYQKVIDNYEEVSPDISYSFFSIGRLYEEKGDKKSALKEYNDLIDKFSSGNWTNLARSRIIYLSVKK